MLYPKNVNPTRLNVVDKKNLKLIEGGVNYFSRYPEKNNVNGIDNFLKKYEDGIHLINAKLIIKLLKSLISCDTADWNPKHFIDFVLLLISKDRKYKKGKLIIGRNRDLRKNPTTMLSEDDRKKGDKYKKEIVLTLYRLKGESKGWENDPGPRWIPNIKLPEGVFYPT